MIIPCINPGVRVSLMVTKDAWPGIVSLMECYDISYRNDKVLNDDLHVRINDIHAKGSDLMKFLDQLSQFRSDEEGNPRKIYILIAPKKKKKGENNNVQEDRTETGEGSEGGTAEGLGDIRPGSNPDDRGVGHRADLPVLDEYGGEEIHSGSVLSAAAAGSADDNH